MSTLEELLDKTILITLEEGVEPSTLWLTATRSNQLSYSSLQYLKISKRARRRAWTFDLAINEYARRATW